MQNRHLKNMVPFKDLGYKWKESPIKNHFCNMKFILAVFQEPLTDQTEQYEFIVDAATGAILDAYLLVKIGNLGVNL